jgi:hypothetical protein
VQAGDLKIALSSPFGTVGIYNLFVVALVELLQIRTSVSLQTEDPQVVSRSAAVGLLRGG